MCSLSLSQFNTSLKSKRRIALSIIPCLEVSISPFSDLTKPVRAKSRDPFQRLEKKMLNNCEVSMDSSTLLRSGRNDNFDDFMVRESTLHKFLKELVTPVSLAESRTIKGRLVSPIAFTCLRLVFTASWYGSLAILRNVLFISF